MQYKKIQFGAVSQAKVYYKSSFPQRKIVAGFDLDHSR